MTLAQQIQTLQSRGLIITDTNKAEQALDAISYFRLADYWYHLEADHHTHIFQPNSNFEELLTSFNSFVTKIKEMASRGNDKGLGDVLHINDRGKERAVSGSCAIKNGELTPSQQKK